MIDTDTGMVDPGALKFGLPPGITKTQAEHYEAQVERIKNAAVELKNPPKIKVALGIDVSLSNTGFAFAEDSGEYSTHALPTNPNLPLAARLDYLMNGTTRMVFDYWEPKPILAIVEQGYSSLKGPSESKLGMARGVVLTQLFRLRVRALLIPSKAIKKFATGNGNADKVMVIEAAQEHGFTHQLLRLESPNQAQLAKVSDEADAYWMAQFGIAMLGCNPNDSLSTEQYDYAQSFNEEGEDEDAIA